MLISKSRSLNDCLRLLFFFFFSVACPGADSYGLGSERRGREVRRSGVEY